MARYATMGSGHPRSSRKTTAQSALARRPPTPPRSLPPLSPPALSPRSLPPLSPPALSPRPLPPPHTPQSRVGPIEWLRPYTDDVLPDLGQQGVKNLVVVPISFVSEHIETLEEIDMEYRELAEENGINNWR